MTCRLPRCLALMLLATLSRSLLTNAAPKLERTQVGPFYDSFINPAVSTSEGNVYSCQDYNSAALAINDFRAAYDLDPVQWDEDLVAAAKATLLSPGEAICEGKAVFDTTNVSYSFAYLANNRESSYKCVQAINFWYSWGNSFDAKDWGFGLPIQAADAVTNETNLAAFAGMMWDLVTSAGCALKVCSTSSTTSYAVVCHFSPLEEFVAAGAADRGVTKEAIEEHVPKQPDDAKRCPRVIITDRRMTLKDIVDNVNNDPSYSISNSSLGVTAERLICYHDQYFYKDVAQSGVAIAVPCPEEDVPQTCMGLEMVIPLLEEKGNCPTTFIADPRTHTFGDIAAVYNKANNGALTAEDLCCYNTLYNTPEYGFCQDIAPLQAGNSYVVVPCPESVKYRKCKKPMVNTTTLSPSDIGLHQCPDIEEAVAARNDVRSYRGLSKLTWNKDFEAALMKDLKENNNAMAVCNTPFSANLLFKTPENQGLRDYEQYVWLIGTLSGNTATPRCTNAALSFDITAQNLVNFNQNFEMPDAFYDTAASFNTFMYAAMKLDSKSFACVLLVCDTFFVNVVCLYDTTWEEAGQQQPGASEWWLNLPENVTTCPAPYWPLAGDTYESIAEKNGLEVQEVMCYHGQAATHNDAQTRWAYGIPLAIPCKSKNPERITCEAYNLYQGACNITYKGKQSDSFDNVATFMSAKRQNLGKCELCVYNGKEPSNCTLDIFEEVTIPCAQDVTDDMLEMCTEGMPSIPAYLQFDLVSSQSSFTMEDYTAISQSLRETVLQGQAGIVRVVSPEVGATPQSRRRLLADSPQQLNVEAVIASNDVDAEQMQQALETAVSSGQLTEELNKNGMAVEDVEFNQPPPPPPAPPTEDGSSGLSAGAIVGIVIGSVAALVVAAAIVFAIVYSRRKKPPPRPTGHKDTADSLDSLSGLKSIGTNKSPCGTADKPPLESIYMSDWLASISSSNVNSTGSGSLTSGESNRSYVINPEALDFQKDEDGQIVTLGKGAFSTVVSAVMDNQKVAVKVMRHTAQHQVHITALLREIAMLRQCQHVNIVQFFGASFAGNDVMMVFENMTKGDLFHALRSPSCEEFLWRNKGHALALSIARGVAYMHGVRIIHCDLKSPNILLNDEYVAKIGDMGMSKYLAKEYITKGAEVGSFVWAAPELLLNSRITEKVDIYSFGIILWELVTGDLPQRGGLREPRVPEECPQEIADLISVCRNVEATDRPTAAEVVLVLESIPPPQRSN